MGFATPIELLRFRAQHGTNDVTDAVLMLLEQLGATPVTQFLVACSVEKFASLNTASKYVQLLVNKGYAETVPDPDDQRIRMLRITDAGRAYLDDWVAGGDNEQGDD